VAGRWNQGPILMVEITYEDMDVLAGIDSPID
jgi:hypothetical protein